MGGNHINNKQLKYYTKYNHYNRGILCTGCLLCAKSRAFSVRINSIIQPFELLKDESKCNRHITTNWVILLWPEWFNSSLFVNKETSREEKKMAHIPCMLTVSIWTDMALNDAPGLYYQICPKWITHKKSGIIQVTSAFMCHYSRMKIILKGATIRHLNGSERGC